MGCCCSKPLPRGREETDTRAGRLRLRGHSSLQDPQLDTHTRQLRDSLGEKSLQPLKRQHSKAETSSHCPISEQTEGQVLEEEELQQHQESEAALHTQIAQLQVEISQLEAKILELMESRALVEKELQQQKESEAALHSQNAQLQEEISQLEAKILGLTERRALVKKELQQREESEAALRSQLAQLQEEISQRDTKTLELTEGRMQVVLQQREESEAALSLCSQIVQLQEEMSEMKVSLTASEESRSQAESGLAQLQQQYDLLKKKCSESPQASLELRDLVNELYEVSEWFQLGLQLKVPFPQLMVIKRSTVQHDVLGKTYMLAEWLNTVGPEASWTDVVAALMRIRMRGLAQRLAEKYGVPVPPVDDATLQTWQGASNNEEIQSTNTQMLAEIQRLYGKLDKKDKEVASINASLEKERSERQTAYEITLKSLRAMEDAQKELKSLKQQEIVIKQQLKSRKQELHYLQQVLQFQRRDNEGLKNVIKNKQEEFDQLQSILLKTVGKLESAPAEVKNLRGQVWQVGMELEASYIRVQELEVERAERQAEMSRERREVEHTLIQKAAALPTHESPCEIEYLHDQAMELLSQSSGHEVTSRQEENQREEQIRELLVRTRKLGGLRLIWKKCQDAPQPLDRGSAAVDMDRRTAYFSDYGSIFAYEWEKEKWSKLRDCPKYDYALAVIGGMLTAVGGVQSGRLTNTLLSIVGDRSEARWEEVYPPVPINCTWTAVVCSGKHLVVIGGEGDDGRVLTTIEVLSIETRQWLTASSLPFPLSSASATVVGDNIYLLGGYDGGGWMSRSVLSCSLTDLLQSCQPHLPTSPLWHQVADIPHAVCTSTCVTLNGELVAVGGCNPSSNPTCTSMYTDAVYAYDPSTDSWNVISHMNTDRRDCLAVVLPGDRLMVMGGWTYEGIDLQTASVEIATVTV